MSAEPPYAAAAGIYWDLGWRGIIPVHPADKGRVPAGFTGYDGIDVTRENLEWFVKSKPGYNVGLRQPDDIIGIDVDAYDGETGAQTLAEAEKRWGRLPDSPRSTSRDDGISGIRCYRIPPGVKLVTILEFPELGIGDIEIIQRHHRYVQCWPSRHVKTGRTYQWLGIDNAPLHDPPAPGDIPDLPAAWLEALREPEHNNGAQLGDYGAYKVRQALTEGEPTRRVAWRLGEAILDCGGASRHDHTRDHVLALLRYGKQGDSGVLPALKALQKAFAAAVGPDRPGGATRAVEEFRDFVNGNRVAQLLAQPDYDDGVHTLDEPPDDDHHEWGGHESQESDDKEHELTTWEPIDLGPYLRGEIQQPSPAVGIRRTDGLQVVYPGREHSVLGETESGKTSFVLGCVAEELSAGNFVVYAHFEEADPASSVERLLLLGVDPSLIEQRLRFVGPARPARAEWVSALLEPAPSLFVLDGVNEGMALHGDEIKDAAGAAAFRRRLVLPFLRVGAATIACDHLPKDREGRGRDAYGSVHKGNAINGARILLENREPFGRRMRGRSNVFVTKDRPGQLRAHGSTAGAPGKTYLGTLVIDDATCGPDFLMRFYAPKGDDGEDGPAADAVSWGAELGGHVYDAISALPEQTVASMTLLYAELRNAGRQVRDRHVRDAVADLIVTGRLVEVSGRRGAKGYRTIPTPARESDA